MFADDVIYDKFLPTAYNGFDKQQQLLAKAHKFTLARDFALAADGLVDNLDELLRIAPFCRLPFPVTWIEFAQADRAHWMQAPLHFPSVQSQPTSIGFLCVAPNPADLSRWSTTLMWSFKVGPQRCNASVIAVDVDLNKTEATGEFNLVTEGLQQYTNPVPTDFMPNEVSRLTRFEFQKVAQVLVADWGGEVRFLFACLGLINARNVIDVSRTDFSRLNLSRAKRGKRQLHDHTVVKIRAVHKKSLLPPKATDIQRYSEIRAHFVRGHWKIRKTGVYWWGAHLRGRGAAKQKDYVVEGKNATVANVS